MAKDFRLPEHVKPINYELFFEPDLTAFKFSGHEKISLEISQPTSEIILNSAELEIKSVALHYKGQTLKPKIKLDKKTERLILKFGSLISENHAVLEIEFGGELNDKLIGFYRSKYKAQDGSEKYLATTQFEAPLARRAFPCFDEPDKKAIFDVALKIAENFEAISNMPIRSETIEGGKKVVRFETTPKMSTYLLYLGVGEFEFLEDKYNDVAIRVVTTAGKKEQGRFSLENTKKFLKYFEDFSGIKYPLPKLDLIAIPDFAYGAMENWGAITFREIALLFDEKKTSTTVKKYVAEVVAHELWHQWSGDLVTMKWWNDLWLNESFATYMAYKAVDNYFPELQMWEDFLRSETSDSMAEDSLKTSHPIDVEVKTPEETEELFDKISYGKGGSVLRMIEGYLGEETFRKGVANYLEKHKYSNATAEDLWASLAEASSPDIKEVMASWINQAGHPLVDAKLKDNKLLLEQGRLVFGPKKRQAWKIPLVIGTEAGQHRLLFGEKKGAFDFQQKPEWYKLNFSQGGYYRARYAEKDLDRLKFVMGEGKLGTFDRWGLLNDMFYLTVLGETNIAHFFNLLKAYENETEYFVLSDVRSSLAFLKFIFSETPEWKELWPKFREYAKKPFAAAFAKLGWEPKKDESLQDSLLRATAIGYLAFAEDQDVVKTGLLKFVDEMLKEPEKIHPDLRGSILYIAATNGDAETHTKFAEQYVSTRSPEEKAKFLAAMGEFTDPELLKQTLDFAFSDKVKSQDLRYLWATIGSNANARGILLKWFEENWQKAEKHKESAAIFKFLLEALITVHLGKEKEVELATFLEAHKVGYKMTVAKSLERLRRNTAFLENNKEILVNYFK